jgi:tricorn protease-like protein
LISILENSNPGSDGAIKESLMHLQSSSDGQQMIFKMSDTIRKLLMLVAPDDQKAVFENMPNDQEFQLLVSNFQKWHA